MPSRPRRAAEPAAKAALPPAPERPDFAARQARLLAEVSHELGNYFHKLYYWAELLREQRAGGESEPAELLEHTIRELETFLKTALELFRPLSLATMAMSVGDVVASAQALLKRHVESSRCTWEDDAAGTAAMVDIDPGRFSFVLDALVRRVQGADTPAIVAAATLADVREPDAFVLTVRARGVRPVPSAVAAAIEWAVIERIVEAHGGTVELVATASERCVRLRLPVRR